MVNSPGATGSEQPGQVLSTGAQSVEKGLARVLPADVEGADTLAALLGLDLARAKAAEQEGHHLETALFGEDPRDLAAQVLAQGVEVVPRMQGHVVWYLVILPVVGCV